MQMFAQATWDLVNTAGIQQNISILYIYTKHILLNLIMHISTCEGAEYFPFSLDLGLGMCCNAF